MYIYIGFLFLFDAAVYDVVRSIKPKLIIRQVDSLTAVVTSQIYKQKQNFVVFWLYDDHHQILKLIELIYDFKFSSIIIVVMLLHH